MIKFGPAGACDRFKEQGYRHTRELPAWLRNQGLAALEYSSGHGVRLREETAKDIGEAATAQGITMSIHAPYYINLASEDEEKLRNTLRYLRESALAIRWMGGDRVIFHAGATGGDRSKALLRARRSLERARAMPECRDVILCPETMGKSGQLGSIADIAELCRVANNFLPAVDFAHLHALNRLHTQGDYRRALDPLLDALGYERMRYFHVHFSHIEYTSSGEKRHRNFDEEGFGPEFAPLADVLLEYKLEPVIICESRGHQTGDALEMQAIYERARQTDGKASQD